MTHVKPATILVVEDNTTVRDTVARALRFAGYDVAEAPHVGAALEILAALTEPPVGVVSDVEMPGLSVRTLIDTVRASRPPIPILLISGGFHEPRVQQMINDGEVPLLPKPFSWADLMRAVRSLLGT